ncbi:MAG: hypothetical protein COV69_00910 [Parcubacteria group bacterium CG11_big_fil_rev_8_21_14_0_20_39_14]|nr:MAG: hypothetical protein COV69_00910 [Parcubacteria group bacterium CG11_big_fil_rev_8_21_14_0_20_39_14]PIS35570.1 MAG: hypothetical protein COT36_01710 [Parcubacteria group bacterium CG08_land_8_20_14_0_20_38_56]
MNKFEKAYKILEKNVKCPSGCSLCEIYGIVFLPNELEFLVKKNQIDKKDKKKFAKVYYYGGHKIYALLMDNGDCPFKNKIGRCINCGARTLDCRTHPAIPIFGHDKIEIYFDKKCPLVQRGKIPKDFKKRARRAWHLVNPPRWWKNFYNKIQIQNFGYL